MKTAAAPWTLRSIEAMFGLGLGRARVMRLVHDDVLRPTRGARNEWRFGFQDVVLLRAAERLRRERVPALRLMQALRQLRARLPAEAPLAALRITAVGDRVAVHDGAARWEPLSGQLLIDFEVESRGGALLFVDSAGAAQCVATGQAREAAGDAEGAIAAHRRALAMAPGHVGALLELGALLCEAGRCEEALALYDAALEHAADEPLLHFNGALALEDLGMPRDAMRAYERCLELAPWLADAHFNLARLHERAGDAQRALRHYNEYRRRERSDAAQADEGRAGR